MAKKMLFAVLWIVMGFILLTNNAICADSVQILYKCNETSPTTNIIRPYFKVVNNGTTTLNLNRVKIRYWYTQDTSSSQSYVCDYAQVGVTNVTGNFVAMGTSTSTADYYFEVGFTTGAGSLNAGYDSGEIQFRFNKDDWSNYTQTNDYSFDATKTNYGQNLYVTGYIDDQLFFGTEPVSTPLNKIDVLQERQTLKAIITALDNGVGQRYDVTDCFDGDTGTVGSEDEDYEYMRSNLTGDPTLNATNPTYVQLEFTTAKNIRKLRANLGLFDQDQTWKVEAADTQTDLDNQTGTYQLVVPESNEITGTQWVESVLATAVTKKFWRFYVKATDLGDHGNVYVSELELYSDDNEAPSTPSQLAATSVDATSIELSWTGSTDNVEVSGYKVYRLNSGQYEYIGITTCTKYTDTLLNASTSYTYKVSAIDAVGNEVGYSNTATASTGDTTTINPINNVLVLYYNPIIKQGNYQYDDPVEGIQTKVVPQDIEFSELYGTHVWADFGAKKFAENAKINSGGSVDFRIYQTIELNELPPVHSPEWMTADILIEYMELSIRRRELTKIYDVGNHGGFNYYKMFRDNNIISLVENGTIDTVWVYFASPNAGMWETSMAGKNPLWVNGGGYDIACSRRFVTYTGGSVECMGHMVESLLGYHSENWPANSTIDVLTTSNLNDPNRTTVQRSFNDWGKFILTDGYNSYGYDNGYEPKTVAPGFSQVGNMHNPPCSYGNYSWDYINRYFDGDTADMSPVDGTWASVDNTYCIEKGSGAKSLVAGATAFRNFTMEVDVKLSSDGESYSNAGVIYRVADYGAGADAFQGYYVGLCAGSDQVILGKMNNNYTQLTSAAMVIQPDTIYHLKVVVNDSNFKVYVNDMNNEKINYTDLNPYNLSGAIGFRAFNVTTYYDNLFINPSANNYAATWFNYPDLSGPATPVSYDIWAGGQDDFQLWVLNHIPKNPGLSNGLFNNWWMYAIDVNHFDGHTPVNYNVTGYPVPAALNVKVQSVTSNSVTLSWTVPPSNSLVTGTKILRNGNPVPVYDGTGSTFTDNNLTTNTTYKYSVITYTGATNSIPIDIEATTMPTAAYFNGFEKVTTGMPDGWLIRSNSGNVAFSADSVERYSGSYSGKIVASAASDSAFFRNVRIKPNTHYHITAWIKTSDISGITFIFMTFPDGRVQDFGRLSEDNGWTLCESEFDSNHSPQVTIHCGINGTGTACFDEVKLVEVP